MDCKSFHTNCLQFIEPQNFSRIKYCVILHDEIMCAGKLLQLSLTAKKLKILLESFRDWRLNRKTFPQ